MVFIDRPRGGGDIEPYPGVGGDGGTGEAALDIAHGGAAGLHRRLDDGVAGSSAICAGVKCRRDRWRAAAHHGPNLLDRESRIAEEEGIAVDGWSEDRRRLDAHANILSPEGR